MNKLSFKYISILLFLQFCFFSLSFYYVLFLKEANIILILIWLSIIFSTFFITRNIFGELQAHIDVKLNNVMLRYYQKEQDRYYYQQQYSQENLEHIKREIHQKINHFQDLEKLSPTEQKELSNRLLQEYMHLYNLDTCQNKIIDAILFNKLNIAKTINIKTSINIIVPNEININPIDLMSVFTNLIDNAIEACLLVPEEHRFIYITAKLQANYLVIKVENSKLNNVQVDIGNMISLKKGDHGLGLKILKDISDKYEGDISCKNKSKSVTIILTLRLKQTS